MPRISVVTPAYNEAENLPILCGRVAQVMHALGVTYEIIVIDDGSTDGTAVALAMLREHDSAVKGIIFSRNFGHQAALNAGLDAADGDAVIIMDADLQQPPEVIAEFYKQFEQGFDIVLGVRVENKQNSRQREAIGRIFYWAFNKMSAISMQPNVADFGLLSRKVVSTLRALPERDRFLRGLVQWVGFRKAYVSYRAAERAYGTSKYSLRKLAHLAVAGITSFSALPLRLSLWLGSLLAGLSGLYAIYVMIIRLRGQQAEVPGWASLILVVLFLGGVQLIILGVIGEYLFKMFYEIKERPLYIVERRIGFEDPAPRSHYGIDSTSER